MDCRKSKPSLRSPRPRFVTTTAQRRWRPRRSTSSTLFRRRSRNPPPPSPDRRGLSPPPCLKRIATGSSSSPSGTCLFRLIMQFWVLTETLRFYVTKMVVHCATWVSVTVPHWRRWRGRRGRRWWRGTRSQMGRRRRMLNIIFTTLLSLASVIVPSSLPISFTISLLLVIQFTIPTHWH